MRIVIDAMCAEFGGIRTYVERLLPGWAAAFPDDEVHVALRAGSTLPTPGMARHEFEVRRPELIYRPLVQATSMHALVNRLRPDVFLATAPTTDVRRLPVPTAVVILDLRSELRPEQFSHSRRVLRRVSYGRSYALANGFIAISQRSLDDLHQLHPGTASRPGTVAYLGSDHVHEWPEPTLVGPVVAFAHHTNKNPELLIRAWSLLEASRSATPPLTFLGVSSELRPRLTRLIASMDLEDLVELSPFLPDEPFRKKLAEARLIAFPSDFEGFGLPVIEGMALGKAVVVGPDPGVLEVSGGHAFVAEDWSELALATALSEALDALDPTLAAAQEWAGTFTWSDTVSATRSALVELADRGIPDRRTKRS